jgi:hypothetical protein
MADEETTERWTVPQASVWIRTRDLATVREMDPRTARSLVETALAFPGVLIASGCLVAALRAGRFSTLGRLTLRQVTAAGAAPDRILGDGRERTPQEFWQSGGALSDNDGSVVAAAPDDAGRWIDLDVEANDCIGHWQPPAAILGDDPLSLGQVAAHLEREPIDYLLWLLTHPAVTVTGLYDRAERPERMTVDRAALARAVIDCEADTVTDGRLSWSAVMVELAQVESEPEPEDAGKRPNAKPRKPTYEEIRAWYADRVEQWPANRLPPPRDVDLRNASQFFSNKGLKVRGIRSDVRKARGEEAPPSWHESGAKSSEALSAHRKATATAA